MKRRRLSNHSCGVQNGAFYLPPEIICEILSRLPIEAILRCKSVCKEWSRLTEDPHFINLQRDRANNQLPRLILQSHYKVSLQNLLLLDTERCNIRKIPFKKMQLPSCSKYKLNRFRLVCSCNGLLCIALSDEIDPVIILNPITRESVILPSPERRIRAVSNQIGFHFDPSSGKYKVVRECRSMGNHKHISIEIITLGESSWRELSAPVPVKFNQGRAVFWNGAFHWKIEDSDYRSGDKCILGFNISDEKFYTISCHVKFGVQNYELLVLGGCLTLVEHDVHLMKIWKVSGTKSQGFYLSFQCTYDTHVRWNNSLFYSVIWKTSHDSFLLKVTHSDSKARLNQHLVQFFPEKALYSPLKIPGLPPNFSSVCFKPTLVSLS
ncbi:F-box protein At3g07870-like [Alnus glutinosa]|uniref:F-box protein At3g07870-like n=1 Tax=Alnus glutinosa TaxID=3517 RepID=UPI002D782D1E|nr:F-box protein At3g07870-like [Alnus glutinosa]XP_062170106.1 F-box protein At3g07870-like [Alnus glutinosa]